MVDDPGMEALAQTIVRLREERRMSARDLAKAAGLDLSTLTPIEECQSEPRWGTLRQIARGLDTELEDLLGQAEQLERERVSGREGRRGR